MITLVFMCWFNSSMSYKLISGNADGYYEISTNYYVLVVGEEPMSKTKFCEYE